MSSGKWTLAGMLYGLAMLATAEEPVDPLAACTACHEPGQAVQAPPFWMVQQRYRREHASEESMRRAIEQWLREPTEEKALLKRAVKQHGLMPRLELTEAERAAAARALVETQFEPPCEYWKQQLSQGSAGMGRMAMLRMKYNQLCR